MHKKKMISPIVVTVLTVLYFVFYFGLLITVTEGIFRIVLGVLPVIFSGVLIKVCIDRIKEIKKGEEDDISKY